LGPPLRGSAILGVRRGEKGKGEEMQERGGSRLKGKGKGEMEERKGEGSGEEGDGMCGKRER